MANHCVWEHNGGDTLLYSKDFVGGVYTRGDAGGRRGENAGGNFRLP